MLWGGVILKYYDDSRNDLKEAVSVIDNYSIVFEENVLRSIGEIDKSLLYTRRLIERRTGPDGFDRIVGSDDLISEIILQVAIADADGVLRASNAGPHPAPALDLNARDHVRIHRDAADDRLFIARPQIGRAAKQWQIELSRRFLNPDGSFGGVVVASLKPEHFTNFYNKLNFGASVSIALIGHDGVVRSSGGSAGGFHLGQNLSDTRFFERARNAAGTTFIDTNAFSGEKRLLAFQAVHGQPLWLNVSTAVDSVYVNALANLRVNVIVGLILTVVMLIAIERILRAEARARQKAEQLRCTLENMSQGIMMVTRDLEIPVINARCGELLDLPPDMVQHPPRFDALTTFQARRDADRRNGRRRAREVPHPPPSERCSETVREMADGTVLEVRSMPLPDGGLVQTFTDITQRRLAEARVARLASEDPLTGLLNRRVFRAMLEDIFPVDKALHPEAESQLALLFLDLDRFKVINDALGHRTGDRLLQEVAGRLRQAVEPGALLARLGGDEFAIAAPGPRSHAEVASLAARLLETVRPPLEIDGYQVRTGASIGIAIGPGDGADVEDLLKAADLALYAAKAESRGTYKFYNQKMSAALKDRREIETDLRAALERNELELHYQPIVSLQDSRISGFEALARWRHPTKGMIPPSQFIPVAEDSGLILSLGDWALAAACREATRWPGDLRVAVNLSPVQLLMPDLADTVAKLLAETGLAPHRLEIEITEQTVLADNEHTIATLRRLKEIGIRIAMDDFGTGYSSLSYLRTFPFDRVKIDRSFVADLKLGSDHAVIVQAVVSIAGALGITTTAEGVESEHQRDFLKALGCNEAQGFLFSPAIPADLIPRVLADRGYHPVLAA
ncbi:EAL domain-containing protein [Blastochloris viridis]|nr:EAL domain-containing protein [Blastochloris viridis]BAR98409.1 diguanylate cyclase/phosphodiesterase with PAS/PAC sensor [Blastochloris viridis]